MHASTVIGEITDAVGLGDLGLAGIVTLTILALLTGRLVPLRQHLELAKDRDHYRDALAKSEEARQILVRQNDELLRPLAATVEHALRSLPTVDRQDSPP